MSNSLINVVNNLNCKNIIKIFCCPVSLNCRNNAVTKNFSCTLTATKLNIFFIKPCLNYRQGFFCDILMYKNSFNRIANRWARSFALYIMFAAISISALSSTKTWQLPTPVSITGTFAFSTTALIRPAPPRGMSKSR